MHIGSGTNDIALYRRLMKERNRLSGLGRNAEEIEIQRVSDTENWDPLYGELDPNGFPGDWIKFWAAVERDPENDETEAREEGRTKTRSARVFIAQKELVDRDEAGPKIGDALRFHGSIWDVVTSKLLSIMGSENNALEWTLECKRLDHFTPARRLAGE